ncbi:hypothetical protein [Actinoplanes sp. NPDC026619]|uniref:hypothetical protein n=1 Tax=Actinoplanes sp. NPDC026619 TaxID=3155798 RepID=UPI0033F1C18E
MSDAKIDERDEENPEENAEAQPEEFLNRAARRAAKSKKHGHADQTGAQAGNQPHGRGAVPARKQFGTRRTG